MKKTCVMTSLIVAVVAFAQQASGQSGGLFGNRTLGGSVGEGNRTLTASPGDRVRQQQSGAGQASGDERFLRQNRQPGQFVGADSGDARNFFSQATNALNAQNQSAGDRSQRRSSNRRSSNGRSGRSQIAFRRQLSVGFKYARPATNVVSSRLEKWLGGIERISRVGPIKVHFAGSTAVLIGKVTSEYDRELVDQLVRLEPGIGLVRNELVVVSEMASSATDGSDAKSEE